MSDSDTPHGTADRSQGVGQIDRSPTQVSSALALLAAVITAGASAYTPLGVASGLAGLLVLALGLVVGRQSPVTVGGGLLVAGVIVVGVAGAPVTATLVGTMTAVLAFDFGTTAVGLGEQLGREAPTAEVELVHGAASTAVGLVVVAAGFAIHEVAVGNQPVAAVVGLLVVVLVAVATLRRVDPAPGRHA
jgi:hypothetical protein